MQLVVLGSHLVFLYLQLPANTGILIYPSSGISRDHWHKRRATGGKRTQPRKKRKFELGRPAANTKVSRYATEYYVIWIIILFQYI